MRTNTILGIAIIVAIVVVGAAIVFQMGTPQTEDRMKGAILTGLPVTWDWGLMGLESFKEFDKIYDGVIDWDFTELIPFSEMSMATREKITNGADIINSWGGEWVPPALEVAPEFPDVNFIVFGVMGPVDFPPNVNYIDTNLYQGDYLEGLIAGSLTKTNKIGMIIGEEYPKVTRMYEAFKAGVREVNPNVEFSFTALGSWVDSSGARLATVSMVDTGVDFIWLYADVAELGAFRAATELGVMVTSSFKDKHGLFPDIMVTSNLCVPIQGHKLIIDTILDGTWEAGKEWDIGIHTGEQWLAPYYQFDEMIPADIKNLVEERFQAIKDGTFAVPEIFERTEM